MLNASNNVAEGGGLTGWSLRSAAGVNHLERLMRKVSCGSCRDVYVCFLAKCAEWGIRDRSLSHWRPEGRSSTVIR